MSACTIPLPELTGCRSRGDGLPNPPVGVTPVSSATTVAATTTTTPEVLVTHPALPFDQSTSTTHAIGTPPEPIALPSTGVGAEFALVGSSMVLTGWALRRLARRGKQWSR